MYNRCDSPLTTIKYSNSFNWRLTCLLIQGLLCKLPAYGQTQNLISHHQTLKKEMGASNEHFQKSVFRDGARSKYAKKETLKGGTRD